MAADAQRQTKLERIDLEGAPWDKCNRLRLAVPGDDIGFPFVSIEGRPGEILERGHAAKVRAMGMRNHDVLQVRRQPMNLAYRVEDTMGIIVPQGIDQGQFCAVVEEKGVDASTFILP